MPPPPPTKPDLAMFRHLCRMAPNENCLNQPSNSASCLMVLHLRPCFATPRFSASTISSVHSMPPDTASSPFLTLRLAAASACACPVPSSTNSICPALT